MTHENAKQLQEDIMGKNSFAQESDFYMNFALNLGDFSKYCLYPFSSCKEYILDSMRNFCVSTEYAPQQTGLIVQQKGLNVEEIKKTVTLAEQQLGFEPSSFELIDKNTLSIIGDSYWSISPYVLSFFALIVRVTQEHGSFDIFKPEFGKFKEGDLATFSYTTYQKFLQDLKDRKFKKQKEQFSKSFTNIHNSGIRTFLNSIHAR